MSKAVMISIKPEWCEKIFSGKKTIEVRKTKPNIKTPFKCYVYMTKSNLVGDKKAYKDRMAGKVIGEFIVNKVECFTTDYRRDDEQTARIAKDACLTFTELYNYEANSRCLYAWHIKEFVLYGNGKKFNEPRELSEFKKWHRKCWYADLGLAKRDCPECKNKGCFLQRPPQSFCYVEEVA